MKKFLKSKRVSLLLISFIILIAASFRLYGLNWDKNQHLHPDERFLTMVVQAVDWPSSLSEYLNQQISPLNPYNSNFNFFVYGTFPLKIVKLASSVITIEDFDYNNITLVGRLISTLFDLGTLIFVYLIAKNLINKKSGLIAALLYATSVLPIQLSHFFTVDTFLVFFLLASFYLLTLLLLRKRIYPYSLLLGTVYGLALATKISALLFFPIIVAGFVFLLLKNKRRIKTLLAVVLLISASYLVFRLADPRVFLNPNIFDISLNPNFVNNLKELSSFNNPETFFPPGIQWISTLPIIYPLVNLVVWGLGIPLGIFSIVSVLYNLLLSISFVIKNKFKWIDRVTNKQFLLMLVTGWIVILFVYQGILFVKAMRYFYPIYPFLAIISSFTLSKLVSKNKKLATYLLISLLVLTSIYTFSFVSIYSRPHSRIEASDWIYKNIPKGTTISCEHWDDCLPLSLDKHSANIYSTEMLKLFDLNTAQKWNIINNQLEEIDYLIMSSNRLWGSIPKVPKKYPKVSKFYKDLFSNKLNFEKVAEFTSYPEIPLLNIPLPDDSADESFSVYDHPKVLIYKKVN